ncbi:MAG TPA: MFS transporter [Chloroflexi bacterium]|nr:MFS transporter [Chloroflexota bacterium]
MTGTNFERQVEQHYRFNAIVNVLDSAFYLFGASFIAANTILPLFVNRFTDNRLVIGLLSTLSSSGWFLPQIFTANWVQRLPRKKVGVVNVGLLSERLPVFLFVPAALLAVRFPTAALVSFFVFFTWYIFGAGSIAVSWQDMIAKIIPLDRRGRFFGIANFIATLMGVLGAATAAWLLDRYAFPYNYALCFSAAAIAIFLSWVFLALTREPAQVSERTPVSRRAYWRSLLDVLRTDQNFRRYLLSRAVVNLGGMATGFLAVYAVQRWALTDSQAGRFTISTLVGQALGNLTLGALADRWGHKLTLVLGALLGGTAMGVAALAPAPAWFHAVFALLGFGMAGFIMSGLMIAFEFSAPDIRPTYIGLNNTLGGIVAALAPIIGGWLAGAIGYRGLFLVAFFFSLTGGALLYRTVREPRWRESWRESE